MSTVVTDRRQELALANGKRILAQLVNKGDELTLACPTNIDWDAATEPGQIDPVSRWARDCHDAIHAAIASKQEGGDKYRWTPDRKRDGKEFVDEGYLTIKLVWTKEKPQVLRKAA
jgi:hypothetical protein